MQSGWDAEKWPRAAEIIRYGTTSSGAGSGWTTVDGTAFSNMLKNVCSFNLPLGGNRP